MPLSLSLSEKNTISSVRDPGSYKIWKLIQFYTFIHFLQANWKSIHQLFEKTMHHSNSLYDLVSSFHVWTRPFRLRCQSHFFHHRARGMPHLLRWPFSWCQHERYLLYKSKSSLQHPMNWLLPAKGVGNDQHMVWAH